MKRFPLSLRQPIFRCLLILYHSSFVILFPPYSATLAQLYALLSRLHICSPIPLATRFLCTSILDRRLVIVVPYLALYYKYVEDSNACSLASS